MTKYVNSFALLDDEEGDDVDVLVDRIVKKVDDLMHAQNENNSSEFVHNGSGGKNGGRGHRDHSRGNGDGRNDGFQGGDGWHDAQGGNGWNGDMRVGDGWNDTVLGGKGWNGDVQVGAGWDGQRRNDRRESYGSEDGRDRGRDQGKGFDGENIQPDVNKANDGADWQDASKGQGGYDKHDRSQRSPRNENRSCNGEMRGYGKKYQDNGAADGQRPYRNGNQNYGGERRGYENQGLDYHAADGRRPYRNGGRSYDGERRVYEDQVQDNVANSGQLSRKVNVYEDNKSCDEERKYRNEHRNYSGNRRGYGGDRGRGRIEYRRTGSGESEENDNADDEQDVKADHAIGSGGDAETVLEASKAVETEELNTSKVTDDITDPKKVTEEQKRKDKKKEWKLKKKEEAEKEAALMTLDQYEKMFLEKKVLVSQNTEVRRVSIDKELEGMRLIQKKPDVSDEVRKSSKDRLKEDNLKKKASVSSKTEDNRDTECEVDDKDAKLKSEEENPKKDGGLEKKEKSHKLVANEVHKLFKQAFRLRSIGGRGQGCSGSGDQGDFRDQTNNGGPRSSRDAASHTRAPVSAIAPAPAPRPMRIPTARDFPVLGANPTAAAPTSVKHSTELLL